MGLLAHLRAHMDKDRRHHPMLGRRTLTCTLFQAGEGPNSVPALARPPFDMRTLPGQTGPGAAPGFQLGTRVNGKVRDKLEAAPDADMEQIKAEALKLPSVVKHMEGKEVVKIIAVPGKLVNVVVR